MRIILTIAAQSLLQSRRRTLTLAGAIAFVTAVFVCLLALSAGVRTSFVDAASLLGSGHVNIAGFSKPDANTASPIITDKLALLETVRKSFEEVDFMVARHRGLATFYSSSNTTRPSYLTGVDVAEEQRLLEFLQPAPSREYKAGGDDSIDTDLSRLSELNSLVLFSSQAKRLGVGVDDMLTVRAESEDGRINTADLTVVGVVRDVGMMGNWTFFTSNETFEQVFQVRSSTTGTVQLYLKDVDRAPAVMARLRVDLGAAGYEVMDYDGRPYFWKLGAVRADDWVGQRLDLTLWSDEVSYLAWILRALDTLSAILITVLLGLIMIGILNTMLMAIRERTQELGTLRAMGMTRRKVLWMVVLEALLLGFAATSVGAFAGVAIAVAVDAAQVVVPSDALREILLNDIVTMRVRPQDVLTSIVSLTLFTGVAAVWPAFRAARLQPVTAMHKVD